jgi:Bacterial Ig-like domain (group 1)
MMSLLRSRLTVVAFSTSLAALAGCGGDPANELSGLTVVAPPSVTAGTPAAVLVLVKGSQSSPLAGYKGTLTLDSDDRQAEITPASYAFTDADSGTHAFTVVFKTAGKHVIHVADPKASAEASQSVEVASAAAAKLVIVSGDGQKGSGGKALKAPLVAQVTDAYGNGVRDRPVTWTTGNGGGSVTPAGATTAADGKASAAATLGAGDRWNTFTASAEGLAPVTFGATRGEYHLVYTDPTTGIVRLVRNAASTETQMVLDLVVAQTPTQPAYAAGFNLPLDATKVALDPGKPLTLPGKLALDPGSAPRAAMAALPLTGPLAANLVTALSQKAAGAGAVAKDTQLASGAVLYSITLNMQPEGAMGVVFDGTTKALITSGGLRNKVGDTVVAAKDVGIGKLEVVE